MIPAELGVWTKGQRAMAGWLANQMNGEPLSQTDLADQFGVAQSLMSRAASVMEWAPDLVGVVLTGELSLGDAYYQARDRKGVWWPPEARVGPTQVDSLPDAPAAAPVSHWVNCSAPPRSVDNTRGGDSV